jgi:hypothetical protein
MAVVEMVALALAVIGIVGANVSLEALVRHEHRSHRKSWEADGRPAGPLWGPKEASAFQGGMSMYSIAGRWLKKTPEWAKNDEHALLLMWCHRGMVSAMVLGALLLIVVKAVRSAG